jgi:hypothetical protein
VFICFIAASGCGPSIPKDSQAREILEKHYAPFTQLGFNMTDFRKLNAVLKENSGQKVYVYSFLAAFKLPSGIAWHSGGLMTDGFIQDPGNKEDSWGTKYESLPKGTTAIARGKITFRLTEKGWVSEDAPDTEEFAYCSGAIWSGMDGSIDHHEIVNPETCYWKHGWEKLNY